MVLVKPPCRPSCRHRQRQDADQQASQSEHGAQGLPRLTGHRMPRVLTSHHRARLMSAGKSSSSCRVVGCHSSRAANRSGGSWTGKEDDNQIRCTAHCQILPTPLSFLHVHALQIHSQSLFFQHRPDQIWDAFAFNSCSNCLRQWVMTQCGSSTVVQLHAYFRTSEFGRPVKTCSGLVCKEGGLSSTSMNNVSP